MSIERFSARIADVTDTTEPGEFVAVAASLGVASSAFGPVRFSERALRNAPRSVPLLHQHDTSQPIGTAALRFDSELGLVAHGTLGLGIQRARETRSLLLAGALNAVSIGFSPRREHWEGGVRVVDDADIEELSVVTRPADPCARVLEVHRGVSVVDIIEHYSPRAVGEREYRLLRDLQAARRRPDWS